MGKNDNEKEKKYSQKDLEDFIGGISTKKKEELKKNVKKETPAEVGSRTASGGFRNERYFRDLLNNSLDSEEARDLLNQLNINYHKIKILEVKKLGGIYKPDNQIFIKFNDGTSQTINISNKKQDDFGFNQLDRRTVDKYSEIFSLSSLTKNTLKKYCGVRGFSPLDLLNSGELPKEQYLRLIDIPEKKTHTEEASKGGRFYLNELSNEEKESVISEFESKKEQIMLFVLNGDDVNYPVDYVVVTKISKKKQKYDHLVFTLEEIFRKACERDFYLSNVTRKYGSNLRIGAITVQKKGGTGGSTNLQFKWTNLYPKKREMRYTL